MELDVLYVMVSLLVIPVLLVIKITQELVNNAVQAVFLLILVIAVLHALEEHILQLELLAVQVTPSFSQQNI